jgi:response regulator receiver domain-containing protein
MDSPTVLCIDDRPQVLELRKATLECHGYRVVIASSGYTAMKMLEETSVAAVLLEYRQEGMDAEGVACHIKQGLPNLPIILLSADDFTCLEMKRRLSVPGKRTHLCKAAPSTLSWMRWIQSQRKEMGMRKQYSFLRFWR